MSILPYTTPFVEDWLCHNTTLGEGAYGEYALFNVRLIHLINFQFISNLQSKITYS